MKLILLIVSLCLIVGCNEPTIKPIKVNNATQPNWILSPAKIDAICEVGSASTLLEAKLVAKSAISQQLNTTIDNSLSNIKSCDSQACKNAFKSYSTHQSTQTLKSIKYIDTFIHQKSKQIYVHACIDNYQNSFVYTAPKNPYQTTKKSCILSSEYPNKSTNELKKSLLLKAKEDSVAELYGELLYSKLESNDGKISHQKMRQSTVGSVRIKGDPKFYNGENFAEICSDVTMYVTQEDLSKYAPKEVKLKTFCYTNTSLSPQKMKKIAKQKAFVKVILDERPSLHLNAIEAEKYIHGVHFTNEQYYFNTSSYCFDMRTTILPYEIALIQNKSKQIKITKEKAKSITPQPNTNLLSGLNAIFYSVEDDELKYPLYQTTLNSLKLAYKKLPFNSKIKRNNEYRIIISGFIQSNTTQELPLTLYADVYSAELLINDKLIVTHRQKNGKSQLKKGLNSLKLDMRTANAYDIDLISANLTLYRNHLN